MKNIFFLLALLSFFYGCNEIPPDIPEPPTGGDRFVLVEEFSGGSCVPCADAAIILEEQLAIHGEKLVVVTAHTLSLGQTAPYFGAKYDFRTEKGQALIEDIGLPLGLPSASIDRKLYEGEDDLQMRRDKWASTISSQLSDPAKANLNLELDFNQDNREISLDITIIPTDDIAGDVRLKALITESHIIDFQITPNGLVEDWEHNHILRDIITDVKGTIIGTDLSKGIPITQSFSYTVPAEDDGLWVADNLEVVVYLTENHADSREVIQAAHVKLKE